MNYNLALNAMQSALRFLLILAALPSVARPEKLIINNVWDHAPVIAYELPEADGRAEAIRYVEGVRDRFKQGHEVFDATVNEESLRAKLKGGFILYTTLGDKSKLLRLASRKLGWELAGSAFRWRDVTAPADELRFIAVGKNPYSKGYCVIYAAGSNRALVGINDLFQGGASYDVFQRNQLLREGLYDQRFVSIERVSKAAGLKDVNQFFRTLQRAHPNLLRNASEQGYRKLKEETKTSVAGKLDSGGGIPVEQLASLLYYAAAYFKDGHTFVSWWTPLNELNTRGRRFPALRHVCSPRRSDRLLSHAAVSLSRRQSRETQQPRWRLGKACNCCVRNS